MHTFFLTTNDVSNFAFLRNRRRLPKEERSIEHNRDQQPEKEIQYGTTILQHVRQRGPEQA